MGTQGHAEVSFFDFPFRQFTFFQRVSNQRSFSFPLRGWSLLNVVLLVFLTPAAEKTKTQEKNSSQKLKEKTQPLGGFSLQARKLKKKTKISS